MRQEIVDALLHDFARRIEEFVDRRADGDDDRPPRGDARRRVAEHQALPPQRLREHRFATLFDERQAAGLERLEHVAIDVVDVDAEAGLGERQHQRDADVPAAADHGEIRILRLQFGHGGSIRAGKIHAHAPRLAIKATLNWHL